ncbi:MAG: hypothetical protein ACLT5P_15275 [Flavonifractor plautii]
MGLLAGKSFSDIAKGIVAGSKTMLGGYDRGSARSIALILTDGASGHHCPCAGRSGSSPHRAAGSGCS